MEPARSGNGVRDPFHQLVEELDRRRRTDWDNVIIIEGDEGAGKSNLGLILALNLDPDFDPGRVIYDHEDWDREYDPGVKQSVYVIDEGGNLQLNRDWNKRENKKLVRILMTARQNNHTLIFCIPNMAWIDKYLREHRARYRIYVHRRGVASVQLRAKNWRTGATWFGEPTMWLEGIPSLKRQAPKFWRRYAARKWGANQSQEKNGSKSGRRADRHLEIDIT